MVYTRKQRSRRHHRQQGGEGESIPSFLANGASDNGPVSSPMSTLTGGRRSRGSRRSRGGRRHHKQRGGDGEEPTMESSVMNDNDESQSVPLTGGRRSRGSRRSGGKKRGHSGGFLTAVGSVLKDAIVPFMLLYGVNKTRKNRSKKGGDDIA